MFTLTETDCQTYLGHTIQEMEDWQLNETSYYVDGSEQFDTLSNAKHYIKSIHFNF